MDSPLDPAGVLFIGKGNSPALMHYRVQMPAEELGADWIGAIGSPKHLFGITTGRIQGQATPPGIEAPDNMPLDVSRYHTIVLQYATADGWQEWLAAHQRGGKRVLIELDDYLHGVRQVRNHRSRKTLRGQGLKNIDNLLRQADGLIVSTDHLANLMEDRNDNIHVCRNGVRATRYRYAKPRRSHIAVGWAGGSGHDEALSRWAPAIAQAIDHNPHSRLMAIGADLRPLMARCGLRERVGFHGGTTVDNYPAMLTYFDVGLAPAGNTEWARSKSELRWLELSALGIPAVVDPRLYVSAEHGRTALCATTPKEVGEHVHALLNNVDLRDRIGQTARNEVTVRFNIKRMSEQWADALNVTSEPTDMFTL